MDERWTPRKQGECGGAVGDDVARWEVRISTMGGNQSWQGVVKRFHPSRCDYLFVHVGDRRRWFIPAAAVQAESQICLGGSKYSENEVEPGDPLLARAVAEVASPG